jgi:sodium/potassium/calcium exchanger 6
LPHAKPVAFLILTSWLGLLFSTIGIAASDFFCIDLSTIAGILGMSESVAGVTFLAFGNGSPDVFSTFAAMSTDSGSLAVGELFGAAGFITAVVAGSMALIRPFHVAKKSFVRDVGFFIVAAAFGMVFLWDGRLHFWECAAMVIYYIFYVVFVVGWHWWLGRKRNQRDKEAAARGHFVPVQEELHVDEEYRDDPDEAPNPRRPSLSIGVSREDWTALEGGRQQYYDGAGNEDEEEEARDRWMSELASNMRLTRPTTRSRRNTVTPVRPSLVGALEFQAVLNSLQKSRNIQTIPMDSRRYSDDPNYTTAQQQDQLPTVSELPVTPAFEVRVTAEEQPHVTRSLGTRPTRTASANDATTLRMTPDLRRLSPIASDEDLAGTNARDHLRVSTAEDTGERPKSPAVHIEPATPRRNVAPQRQRSKTDARAVPALLAPPVSPAHSRASSIDYFVSRSRSPSRRGSTSPEETPTPVPSARSLPKIFNPRDRSPGSSRSTSPFPTYRDFPSPTVTASLRSPVMASPRSPVSSQAPSFCLPAPLASIASAESIDAEDSAEQERPRRPGALAKIWPYSVLPPPGVLVSTLFPTIYHWHEKTWWEKMLGIVAAPSVLCLTITLPVVEYDKDFAPSTSTAATTPHNLSLDTGRSRGTVVGTGTGGGKATASSWMHEPPLLLSPAPDGGGHHGVRNSADVAVAAEQDYRREILTSEPEMMDHSIFVDDQESTGSWNRWLTVVQLFTAPILIVLSIFVQAPDGLPASWLVRPILICLLVSVVLLVLLLLTTTPTHRPSPYRIILSLSGFVVSIAWISAVASQVVGALKALAVILNMSHAIMGLTIFAVGNSLGDLVADVTVAKLGYPVMALSACFGGPMLNILLGVGLSGSYLLIQGAEHRHEKHPKSGLKFHTYHIPVSRTLIVSGITLLVTLTGLLIAVPLNNWVLSRKIGWSLIALWTASTLFNVMIETTSLLGDDESMNRMNRTFGS